MRRLTWPSSSSWCPDLGRGSISRSQSHVSRLETPHVGSLVAANELQDFERLDPKAFGGGGSFPVVERFEARFSRFEPFKFVTDQFERFRCAGCGSEILGMKTHGAFETEKIEGS